MCVQTIFWGQNSVLKFLLCILFKHRVPDHAFVFWLSNIHVFFFSTNNFCIRQKFYSVNSFQISCNKIEWMVEQNVFFSALVDSRKPKTLQVQVEKLCLLCSKKFGLTNKSTLLPWLVSLKVCEHRSPCDRQPTELNSGRIWTQWKFDSYFYHFPIEQVVECYAQR